MDTFPDDWQRQQWYKYHSNNPESRALRAQAQAGFWKLFPNGHQTSIKGVVEDVFEELESGKEIEYPFDGLLQIQPRARPLLLRHGKDYRSLSARGKQYHLLERQPKPHYCYSDAAVEMALSNRVRTENQRPITYVEGIVMGSRCEAVFHAWNGVGFSKRCMDWCYYAKSMWNRHFGVPFTQTEYLYIIQGAKRNPGAMHMLFRHDHFEDIEERLVEV